MKTFEPKNRNEWRNWLEENHSERKEIWLVYYKKHTNQPTITYKESVEEAICFGWIDGIKKRIDSQKYTHRFTPRKKNSKWSPANIQIAERMIKAGMMTAVGLKAYENRQEYEIDFLKNRSSSGDSLTPEIEKILKTQEKAWNNFNNLSPSCRKQYVLWINSAKKEATKQKRLAEAIRLLEQNKKLGMK